MRTKWKKIAGVLIVFFGMNGFATDAANDLLNEQGHENAISEYVGEMGKEFKLEESAEGELRHLDLEKSVDKLKDWESSPLNTEEMGPQVYFRELKVEDNEVVRFFIQYYATLGRVYLQRALKRMELYWPVVREYAEELGLPLEVAVLGILESGYDARAMSHKGAGGVWQIMPATAGHYKLKINARLDERKDIVKSTRAALLFLKELANQFNGDWDLVLAAYNGGPNYLKKMLAQHKKKTFWEVSEVPGFKSETLEFVPRFHALLHIMKNPGEYLFKIPELEQADAFDMIRFSEDISFDLLSKYAGIPMEIMEELNPHLKGNEAIARVNFYLPNQFGNLVLKKIRRYYAKLRLEKYRRKMLRIVRYRVRKNDTLLRISKRFNVPRLRIKRYNRLKSSHYLKIGQILKIPVYRNVRSRGKVTKKYRRTVGLKGAYRVKTGDTLSGIASRHGTTVARLKRANRLKGSMVRAGQRLIIPPSAKYQPYRVAKGDTLTGLSRMFGVSVRAIMRANKLRSRHELAAGKTLLIPDQGS